MTKCATATTSSCQINWLTVTIPGPNKAAYVSRTGCMAGHSKSMWRSSPRTCMSHCEQYGAYQQHVAADMPPAADVARSIWCKIRSGFGVYVACNRHHSFSVQKVTMSQPLRGTFVPSSETVTKQAAFTWKGKQSSHARRKAQSIIRAQTVTEAERIAHGATSHKVQHSFCSIMALYIWPCPLHAAEHVQVVIPVLLPYTLMLRLCRRMCHLGHP